MTIIKKCYLDNRDAVVQLLSSSSTSIDSIDNLLFKLTEISINTTASDQPNKTPQFNSGQFINLCNFYRDICAKTTELAKNKLKQVSGVSNATNLKISYGFDEEYVIGGIFSGIKKYALAAFDVAEKWDLFLQEKCGSVEVDIAKPIGFAISKREICVLLAASVFGLTNDVSLLNFIVNNDIIPFTCILEYFNRRLDMGEETQGETNGYDPLLVIKHAENDVTEKMLNKMCNLVLAADDKALPRVMLFVADTSLYSSICYNQIHHIGAIGKAISYECNKNLEMPEIMACEFFKHNSATIEAMPPKNPISSVVRSINYVFGAEYYSCIKPSQDVSIKHQMYGVGAIHDKFPRTTDGTVARCIVFDEINPAFFRSTQKQTNITRILNYFDIFAQRIHFYRTCCSTLFIDTPQNSICVSINPQAIRHIQILEFFAVLIAAGLEDRDIEFHTGLVDVTESYADKSDNSQDDSEDKMRKEFGEQFLAFMQKCRKKRLSIAELYTSVLEFIKKIKRDVNNGYGEFDLMKVSFFDVI